MQAAAFGGLAAGATPAVVERLRAAPVRVRRVLDVGCGAGVSTRILVEAGFDTVAIEPSPSLLAMARQAAPGARFVQGSAYGVPLEPCEGVLALGEPLTYHAPEADAEARLRGFLAAAARALAPGGLLAFDLIVTDGPGLDGRGWVSAEGWAILYETREDRPRRRLTRTIETFRRAEAGAGYRRAREVHEVRTFEAADVMAWLGAAGFEVEVADRYGAHALAPRRRAFFGTRRAD